MWTRCADDAPLLHETLKTDEGGKSSEESSNIASVSRFVKGDPDAGFAEADLVVERTFETGTVHQGYIEPHACTAFWDSNGHLTVWACTQGAFTARDTLAAIIETPVSDITYIPTELGGGFGGKDKCLRRAGVCNPLT